MLNDLVPWFGLAAVALGGILTLIAAALQDRRRRRFDEAMFRKQQSREDLLRLEQRRFDIYSDLLRCALRVYSACRVDIKTDQQQELIAGSMDQFLASVSPAFLITTSDEAAKDLADMVRSVRELVEFRESGRSTDEIQPFFDMHRDAVKKLERSLRRQIGIVGPLDGSTSSAKSEAIS